MLVALTPAAPPAGCSGQDSQESTRPPPVVDTIVLTHEQIPNLVELPGRIDPRATMPLRSSSVMTRSEEHTSELQSLMRISYAVFCLKKKKKHNTNSKYIQ